MSLFKHFFLYIEGSSEAPKKLPAGAVYNKIAKIDIDYKKTLSEHQVFKVSSKIKKEIEEALAYNANKEVCNKPLRDDQACLLIWSAKVSGIEIPEVLTRFLAYHQEEFGLARWLTAGIGYLRIYYSVVGTDILNSKQMRTWKQFVSLLFLFTLLIG